MISTSLNSRPAIGPEKPLFPVSVSDMDNTMTGRDLLIILFKRKFVIVSFWLSITLLVGLALFTLPPAYVTEAKVLVKINEQGRPTFLSDLASYDIGPDLEPATRKLETEMEIMLSRPLVEQVVRELNLKPEDMYRPPYVHLLAPVGDLVNWIKLAFFDLPAKPPRDFENAVNAFTNSLKVAPAKSKSGEATPNLIQIQFKAAKASVAHDALARLMFHYQHFSNELDQKSGQQTYDIVERRLQKAADDVALAQRALKDFAAKVPPAGVEPSIPINNVTGEAGQAITSMMPDQPSGTVQVSIQRNRVAKLEIELAEQQQRFTNEVETVAAAKQELASARKTLAEKTAKSADNADQLLTLQRNLRLAEDLYIDIRHKLTQIELFLAMNPDQISSRVLVDPPLLPESSEWKKSVVIAIAASVAGLMLGLGLASLLEYSDHRYTNPDDVERFTGLPLLITIDQLDDKKLRALIGAGKVND
ncbi:MAG: GumC family protein [Gammaproteobacteria bacterium]